MYYNSLVKLTDFFLFNTIVVLAITINRKHYVLLMNTQYFHQPPIGTHSKQRNALYTLMTSIQLPIRPIGPRHLNLRVCTFPPDAADSPDDGSERRKLEDTDGNNRPPSVTHLHVHGRKIAYSAYESDVTGECADVGQHIVVL